MRQIAVYTALEGAETMKNLSIMIKPASSLCNMRCVYCFYADVAHQRDIASYGLISDDTLETMLRAIFADLKRGDHLNLAFQGGEPTLAGLNFFRSVIRKVSALNQGVHVHYALQTNGLLLDDEWCAFLHENRFLVGLSYDLLPNRNDEARVDVHGQGTTKRVLETAKRLDRHQVEYNILCTLTEYVARNPHKVWNAIRQHPFLYVQFTPCLDDLEKKGSPYALKPASFASFYTQLFDDWFQEYRQGNYWSIKLFDDLIHRIAYGSVNACGLDGHCQPQLVVETAVSTPAIFTVWTNIVWDPSKTRHWRNCTIVLPDLPARLKGSMRPVDLAHTCFYAAAAAKECAKRYALQLMMLSAACASFWTGRCPG